MLIRTVFHRCDGCGNKYKILYEAVTCCWDLKENAIKDQYPLLKKETT